MGLYVYILQCRDRSYYVGMAGNIEQRLQEHNTGVLGGYTAKRLPVNLVYLKYTGSYENTLKVETQIKKWSRAKKEALIRGDIKSLKKLSKKLFSSV